MNWEPIWSAILVAGTWAVKHLGAVAAEAVAYAEKAGILEDGRLSNEELEALAVEIAGRRLPLVPRSLLRWAIRRVCRWRKETREEALTS